MQLGFEHFNEIGIINQLATTRFERQLPHGLTIAQFGLLNHCARLGDGWGPARLAAALQITKAAITNIVAKLEAKGFVIVEVDPHDKRAKRVLLTRAGRKAREEAIRASQPILASAAKALTQKEAGDLLEIARKLRIWLDEHR